MYPEVPPPDFQRVMQHAQTLHAHRRYDEARGKWQLAQDIAPNPLGYGTALRGEAASTDRTGDHSHAVSLAIGALDKHRRELEMAASEEYKLKALREHAESASVVGRLLLSGAIRMETAGQGTLEAARDEGKLALSYFDTALKEILEFEAHSHTTPDQYHINLMSRIAIGYALYGDQAKAKSYARTAITLGWQSESANLPSGANISQAYRWRAKARAVPRGYAAAVASRIATLRPRAGRRIALAIASSKFIGL